MWRRPNEFSLFGSPQLCSQIFLNFSTTWKWMKEARRNKWFGDVLMVTRNRAINNKEKTIADNMDALDVFHFIYFIHSSSSLSSPHFFFISLSWAFCSHFIIVSVIFLSLCLLHSFRRAKKCLLKYAYARCECDPKLKRKWNKRLYSIFVICFFAERSNQMCRFQSIKNNNSFLWSSNNSQFFLE